MNATDRRRSGRATASLLLVLVLMLSAGGFNYHRNWQAELKDDQPRPFKAYETADLESLRDAYAAEAEAFEQRYQAQESRRQRASGQGLMGERVDEFERIQQNTDRLRELRADVADREARLRDLEAELAFRSETLSGMKLHLKRLLTI